ncbi:uncharacterized protein LOC125372888 [Haliotis rufescens]|uniref:uncharacterized protein LOC125372888 n=1 Tax=Haliotis rufescens TaxID=6454 RepID=UPI00201EEE79|nr:uncharacterized protein LOC125372888 [Haliotis rufescens]
MSSISHLNEIKLTDIGRVFGSFKTIASSTGTNDSTTKRSTMATTGKEVVTTQSTTVGIQPSSVSTTNYILRTTGSTTKDSLSAVRPTTKEDNNDTLTIATIANLCVLTTIVCIILFLKLVKPKMSRSSPSQNPYSSSHVEHTGEAEFDHYNYLSAIPSNTHSNVNSLGHSESQEYASVDTFGNLEDDPPRDVS